MKLSESELHTLHDVACEVARQAGELIESYADSVPEVQHKEGSESLATQVVTEVDFKCDALIRRALQPTADKYDLALLTEETEDDGQRLTKDYFWCVDPLDGTLPFTRGLPGYGVSIALIEKSGKPVIGVAYDPREHILYSAISGRGARRNGQPWQPLEGADRANSDRFTVPLDCSFVEQQDFAAIWASIETWSIMHGYKGLNRIDDGGAVMSALWVLEQTPGCYFKQPKDQNGGGSVWDFAATACIFEEVGAIATDYAGDPFNFNPEGSTYMNQCGVIFASHDFFAKECLKEEH